MPIEVLCALDPAAVGRELRSRLRQSTVSLAPPRPREIAEAIAARLPELVVASTTFLPTPLEDWVAEVASLPERPAVVLVHAQEDPRLRAALIRAGCLAVLNAALPLDELAATLQALIQRRLGDARSAIHSAARPGRCALQAFVCKSRRMEEFMALARRVVESDSSLLLLGETGTGKERLARVLHQDGPRSGGPFVAVNCGAFPETLLDSELFGYEKGAFTGASRLRRGYFEQAEGGTLFLDEIGEVPLHLQVKLLRAIEERSIQRLGGEQSVAVDIRIMAATNRDLDREVEEGRFRRDLYYRLAVVTLSLPPLRERVEDVPALFESYVEHFRIVLNRPLRGVEPAAMEALARYGWPGNVRELINVAERAVLLSPGPDIRLADLPRAIAAAAQGAPRAASCESLPPAGLAAPWLDKPLRVAREEAVAAFEAAYLAHQLRATRGRIGETARRAGIDPRSLYKLMRRNGLRKEDFRPR